MKQNSYRMDDRTLKDIRTELAKLAKSYVPEWSFDQNNPDIGSVIALLFSDQLYGNVERFNQTLSRYHTELVNLLDISLLPAHPACATVLMEIAADTPGVKVEQGTKLLAEQENGRIVFETSFPVYLTGARMDAAFMTSKETGRVIPVMGRFLVRDYAGGEDGQEGEEEETVLKPFRLFDFRENGLERQAMLLYHSGIFDVENETISCRLPGNPDFLRRFAEGGYRFLYYTKEGFLPVENCQAAEDRILISKEKVNKKVAVNGSEYSLLVLEAERPQTEDIMFDSVAFSSSGRERPAEYAGNGSTDFSAEQFEPFGDTLALFSECYIGMDSYFSKAEAKLTIRFRADFAERYVGYQKREEKQDLRIIKKKPRNLEESSVLYAYAEEISVEYYNGIGWKRLECEKDTRRMFTQAQAGEYEITFRCPEDWEPLSTGAYFGRAIRLQLLKSDNCYFQPCIHCYPRISKLRISYTYEEQYVKPEIGRILYGTCRRDFTRQLLENQPFIGFSRGNYTDTALYLGFNAVFENGPVSLWWKLSEERSGGNLKLRYYYSTSDGFKEMKIVDYTDCLSRSGIMLFLPPADMGVYELEGKKLCWLKIAADGEAPPSFRTRVEAVVTNAVEARNIETLEEEEFYIDTVSGDMSFSLRADGILTADVWVNEKDTLTEEAMRRMLREQPERVRAVRNYLGDMEEFYVKWEERDNFNSSTPDSRHYVLDRMLNRIRFGDGVHVRIPQNTNGTAFTVQIRRCRGKEGNVAARAISESSTNLMYVQSIYNPEPAFGGSNMETLDRALMRGAGTLSSGGRFVTEADYIREIKSFSETIDKASVILGRNRSGMRDEKILDIVLLMKDFESGPASFQRMCSDLKAHLLKHCELTIAPEELLIEAPIFVELSVDVWAQIVKLEDSFEIRSLAEETLKEYLNPISDERNRGWEIGVLPRKAQIVMRLNALKSKALIRQVVVTAKYTDETGTHETDLDDMTASPFMVVRSGRHRIHITKAQY